ncbi:hypothetical protein K491DRAFT_680409 [Lophiostoma macrostomum CBS 122681]|uniref:Uncharacterized protein n=1 Tax=Lophiostoma macrostomum CBS 122681 TaxID=1314788 RepID=A0A6A6T1B2_9PLEO|nr:hypothetical protein K491DRAFT_680409 [Lophiostoma macrostomum CBS 122681]
MSSNQATESDQDIRDDITKVLDEEDEDQPSEVYYEHCYQAALLAEPHILGFRERWSDLQAKKAEEMLTFLDDQNLRSAEEALAKEERPRLKANMRSVRLFTSVCNYEVELDFLQNAKPGTYPVLQSRVPKEWVSYRRYYALFHDLRAGLRGSDAGAEGSEG